MSLPEMNNLMRISQLKAEPRNAQEVTRMPAMAQARPSDAKLNTLSLERRFTSAYNAARAATLAAFRWRVVDGHCASKTQPGEVLRLPGS